MASAEEKSIGRVQLYQKVFDSPEGIQVLNDMISVHKVLSSTFDKDAMQMSFNEGERNVVLRILHILNLDVAKLRERVRQYAQE